MLKTLLLSTAITVAYSPVGAMTSGGPQESPFAQHQVRLDELRRQMKIAPSAALKLEEQLNHFRVQEEQIRASKGQRAHKTRKLQDLNARIQDLDERLKSLVQSRKRHLRTQIKAEREAYDDAVRTTIFSQPFIDLMTTYTTLPDNGFSMKDVEALIDVYPHLKRQMITDYDWQNAFVIQQNEIYAKAMATLEQDNVSLAELNHFMAGTLASYDRSVEREVARLTAKRDASLTKALADTSLNGQALARSLQAVDAQDILQAARFNVLKRQTLLWSVKSYDAYKKAVTEMMNAPANKLGLHFNLEWFQTLTMVPPLALWQKFTSLQMLDLSNTQVQDISVLAGLEKLEWLYLDNTQVSAISVLAGLEKLEWLYLDNTQVQDISVLAGLEKLKRLFLSGLSHLLKAMAGEDAHVAEARIQKNRETIATLRARGCQVYQ